MNSAARPSPSRNDSVVLPLWSTRLISALLCVGAFAVPWAATSFKMPIKQVQLRPELILVPGGTFLMGSPESESGRNQDEKQRSVNLEPFAIFRTEVTLQQWQAIMSTRSNHCTLGCEDPYPVHQMSWQDAVRYANRLTDEENKFLPSDSPKLTRCYDESSWAWVQKCTGYRLPTEEEWEYAARAGSTTAYSFGDTQEDICKYGNGRVLQCNDDFDGLAPVASFASNAWGLYDMYGNASEWVWTDRGHEPGGVYNGVVRGGSFNSGALELRSAYRDSEPRTLESAFNGFRLVRSVK